MSQWCQAPLCNTDVSSHMHTLVCQLECRGGAGRASHCGGRRRRAGHRAGAQQRAGVREHRTPHNLPCGSGLRPPVLSAPACGAPARTVVLCRWVQVVRVLLEMARADMSREADALAALLSAPGVRKAPQVRAHCDPAVACCQPSSLSACVLHMQAATMATSVGPHKSRAVRLPMRAGRGARCCCGAGPGHSAADPAVLR